MEVRYMNKSRSLIDIFIIYAIEILCNINVNIIININIKIVLDIAVIQISYNFFYRTSILYIKILFISIILPKNYSLFTFYLSYLLSFFFFNFFSSFSLAFSFSFSSSSFICSFIPGTLS